MHAVLITAYKDPQQLENLITELSPYFHVAVNIDARHESSFDFSRLSEAGADSWSIRNTPHGSSRHLDAVFSMMKEALKNPSVEYFHLISGQDFPLLHPQDLRQLFEGSTGIYTEVIPLDHWSPTVRDRISTYDFLSSRDRTRRTVQVMRYFSRHIQKRMLRVDRVTLGNYSNLFKGLIWSSFPRQAARFVVDTLENDIFFASDLKRVYIPEEFVLQTILMNSPYAKDIVPHDLRYAVWDSDLGSPRLLSEDDFEGLAVSPCIFGRKFLSGYTDGLTAMIREKLWLQRANNFSLQGPLGTCEKPTTTSLGDHSTQSNAFKD